MAEKYDELMKLANQVSRSTVAVVDAVTQRGGFKGEELSTIGPVSYTHLTLPTICSV